MLVAASNVNLYGQRVKCGGREGVAEDGLHQKVNVILWKDAMGSTSVPAQLIEKQKKDDDD